LIFRLELAGRIKEDERLRRAEGKGPRAKV